MPRADAWLLLAIAAYALAMLGLVAGTTGVWLAALAVGWLIGAALSATATMVRARRRPVVRCGDCRAALEEALGFCARCGAEPRSDAPGVSA